MKTKNIRIKKRGGGTRLQRVQVLASGKYKFIKNRGRSAPKKRAGSKPKRRVKRTARRKRRRGKRNMTIPLAPIAGIGFALAGGQYPPLEAAMAGNYEAALIRLAERFCGVGRPGVFEPHKLAQGLFPVIMGLLVHKFVGGPPLNANRMLAAAGVPLIRI